jgi:DHA1 family bicyclomycin/chloramphenicol resistance-like MFS transporter
VVRDLYSGVMAARFFSLMLLVTGIVPVLAPIIGGQLLSIASWHTIFLTLAVISALFFLLIARGLPETLPAEARRKGGVGATLQTFRQLLHDRGFVGYALAFGLALGALSAYASGATFVLQQIFMVSPQNVSLVYSMNSLGFMLVGQLNGYLVSRVPPRRLLVIGMAGMTLGGLVFLAAILASAGLNVMLPALFVLVASMGFIMPNMMTLALAAYPQSAGSAAALLGCMPFACGTITAPLAGIGGPNTALPMALTIVVCAAGALMLSMFATHPRG